MTYLIKSFRYVVTNGRRPYICHELTSSVESHTDDLKRDEISDGSGNEPMKVSKILHKIQVKAIER